MGGVQLEHKGLKRTKCGPIFVLEDMTPLSIREEFPTLILPPHLCSMSFFEKGKTRHGSKRVKHMQIQYNYNSSHSSSHSNLQTGITGVPFVVESLRLGCSEMSQCIDNAR